MAGGSENTVSWMLKAVIISSIVFAGLFCFLYFTAPKIEISSSSASSSSFSSSLSGDNMSENESVIEEVYGCGNPRFTVQQWTLINLPIAVVIIIFFGFFQPRTKLWPGCCGGRPSVAYPVNLLDSYSNRLAFLCAFGITCLGILDLFTGNYYLEPNYNNIPLMVQGAVRTLISYVNVLAIGLVHYPIMISLTVEKWVVSDIVGLLYTFEWSFQYFYSLVECPWNSSPGSRVNNMIVLPIYLCYVMLIVLFVKRMRYNYSVKKKIRKGLEVEIHDYEEDFQKTHYYERVCYLFTPKEQWENEHQEEKEPGCCVKLIRKYYKNEPGFRFSRRIICTIGLSALCLYCVGILYEASSVYIENWSKDTFSLNGTLYQYYEGLNSTDSFYRWKDVVDTFAYTFSPTAYSAMGTMICYTLVFFITYRRNTLRLWRGDRSFCPKEEFNNVTLVVSSLKYSGYHIAFVIWGFVLLHLTLWLLVFLFIYLLVLPLVNDQPNWAWDIIKNQWLTLLVYLIVYYSQVLNAKFVFLQNRGKELSINNRRMFHVQVYFYLFLNVLIGLASCLYRIFKSVLFGLLLVGRIDRCLLMRGFELYDSGYKAYLGFLQLEVAHTHPVVVTFCHYLLKDLRERNEKILEFSEDEEVEIPTAKSRNPRPRTRWFLAFTLIRNRHLLLERFNSILEARQLEHQAELEKQRELRDAEVVKGATKSFLIDDDVDGNVDSGEMKGYVDMELTSSTDRGLTKDASGTVKDNDDEDDGERKNTGRRDGIPSPKNSKNRDENEIVESNDEHKIPSTTTPPDDDISNELKTNTVSMSHATSTLSAPESFKASSSSASSSPSPSQPTIAISDSGSNDSEIQEHHRSAEKISLISSKALENEIGESNSSTTLNMTTDIDVSLPGTPLKTDE